MRLREFTDPDKYLPPETWLPNRARKTEKNRNDHPDDEVGPGVTRKPDIRECRRYAGPISVNRP